MSAILLTGGGSLDGLALELPAEATAVVTIEREGGRSHYVVDDTAGTAWFTGLNEQGREMREIIKAFTAAGKAEAEALEAASRPAGCGACGRTFANAAAKTVHADRGQCLPDGAYGQLVEVDGVWDSAWRHPELR